MNQLREIVGRRVAIFTLNGNGAARDEGVLEGFDGIFVRVSSKNETLYFPVHNIRLLKVLE